jgi:Kef-type K+ transport system membrane component KefB
MNALELILLLLLVAASLAVVAERLKIPYPILLVVGGLGLAASAHCGHWKSPYSTSVTGAVSGPRAWSRGPTGSVSVLAISPGSIAARMV